MCVPISKVQIGNSEFYSYSWSVEDKENFPYPMNHNIGNRLNNGNSLFETQEEAIIAHDNKIREWSRHQNTKDRKNFIKKLINADAPELKQIEIDSIVWYNSLTEEQKKFCKWIKDYYEEI